LEFDDSPKNPCKGASGGLRRGCRTAHRA
jgi:hypothetical protein